MGNKKEVNQPTRKEQQELERKEMERQRDRSEKNRRLLRIAPWVAGGIVLVGLIFLVIVSPDTSNKSSKETVGQSFPVQGRDHIKEGQAHPQYNSNPPTSGPHYEKPDDWGFYDKELPDEQLVHNIEHGGIWISFKDIDEETKNKLKELSKKYPGSVIVTSRTANDTKIAVASWAKLEKMDAYDEEKIIKFITLNKNKSPEPLAR